MANTPNNIVCIDSMICVWGLKKEATPSQLHMIASTEAFIDWLDNNNKHIMIPAPVITEIIAPIDDVEHRDRILEVINKNFMVGSLDAIASVRAGEVWNQSKDWKEVYTIGGDTHKKKFKFDTLIIGIAMARNVDVLYTYDKQLIAIGGKFLRVENPPVIPIQTSLNLETPDNT